MGLGKEEAMKLSPELRGRNEADEKTRRVLDTAKESIDYLGGRIRELKGWEKDYFARTMGPLR